jgi:hypothetical protein
MVPILISQAVNTGSPFITTYQNGNDDRPLDFSLSVLWVYLDDALQAALMALAIAAVVGLWLARRDGARRVALVTAANLAVNLAFYLTHPIATPYYVIAIALLSLWSVLFALELHKADAALA